MPWPGRPWLLAGSLGLAACASLPHADYDASNRQPAQVELAAVPFHPQEAYQCGPAALATILGAAGVDRPADLLRQAVFLPGRQGSLQVELLAATRRTGLLPYVLPPAPDALLAELAAGNPVLILQDLGFALAPRWHYAVVVGYDRPGQQMILRSGTTRRQTTGFAAFDRSWAKSGRWAFVALPPGRLPASATPERFVAAAATLEAVAPAAAREAYAAALASWPDHLLVQLARGNAAYRRHDLAAAEAAYRKATVAHPESADAWNNLAQTLHEAGQRPAALAAAERAVTLGGPRREVYLATQSAIERGTSR